MGHDLPTDMKTTSILVTFLFLSAFGSGQTSDQVHRKGYSGKTNSLLIQLDSLLSSNDILEFRAVGDGGRRSDKFVIYTKLVQVAAEDELLGILNDSREYKATRGYAYMAYAFKCDTEKKKEKTLNYNFKIETLKGCIGHTMTFTQFKSYCRQRNSYDPFPKNHFADQEEKQAIQEENKIRKEHGENERVD